MSNFQQGFALIIGIGNDLPMTEDDAQVIYDVLADPSKSAYPKENIQLVTGKNATRKNIEAAFDKLIADIKNVEGATAIVYYSGHGAQVPWIDGKQHYFLVPNDANFEDLDSLLPAEIFTQKINQIESNKLMVILDCCHAEGQHATGQAISKSFTVKGHTSKGSNEKLLQTLQGGSGKIFIASCKDNELSYIGKSDKNSLFTKHLARALDGQNSSFYDFVHVVDIIQYLFRMVPKEASSKLKVAQTPIINYADKLDADFFICANNQGEEKEMAINSADATVKSKGEIDAITNKILKDHANNIIQNTIDNNEINVGEGDVSIGSNNNNTTVIHNYYGTNPNEEDPTSKSKDIPASDSKAYLKEAKKLIADGKAKKAIDLLMDNTNENDTNTTNMLFQQIGRINQVNKQVDMGIATPEYAMRTNNQINNSLLSIISDLGEKK